MVSTHPCVTPTSTNPTTPDGTALATSASDIPPAREWRTPAPLVTSTSGANATALIAPAIANEIHEDGSVKASTTCPATSPAATTATYRPITLPRTSLRARSLSQVSTTR